MTRPIYGELPPPMFTGQPHPEQDNAEPGPLGMDWWPTPGDVVIYRTIGGRRIAASVQQVGNITGNLRLRLPGGELAVDVKHGPDRDQWLLMRECVWVPVSPQPSGHGR